MRTDLERRQAFVDIRDTVREWGEKLKFFIRSEADVKRGSLGTVISKSLSSIEVSAYPIQRNPDEKQLTKAGLSHECSALIYTSALAWSDLGMLDLDDLILDEFDLSRMTVALDGKEMKISQIGFGNRINHTPSYVPLTLRGRSIHSKLQPLKHEPSVSRRSTTTA